MFTDTRSTGPTPTILTPRDSPQKVSNTLFCAYGLYFFFSKVSFTANCSDMEKMHPYQWIPFGGGPRTCIGMPFALTETKVALSMMLRKFSFQMAPGEKVVVGPNPLKPLTGVKMVWNRRNWAEASQKLGKKGTSSSSGTPKVEKDRKAKKPMVEDIPEDQWAAMFKGKPVPVTILYASNQGASKSYAQTLASELEMNNFLPEVATCDEFDSSAVSKLPVLIVVSSTYNGLPPDNAEKFCAWLGKRDLPHQLLESTRFAVFGCGNKQWHTTFQRVPRMMQKRLAELGGEALLDLVEGDEGGDMETQFLAWKTELITVLCDEFQRVPATLPSATKPSQIPSFKPHYVVKFVNAEANSDAKSHGPVVRVDTVILPYCSILPTNFFLVPRKAIQEIQSFRQPRATITGLWPLHSPHRAQDTTLQT
jgi:flavodoxin